MIGFLVVLVGSVSAYLLVRCCVKEMNLSQTVVLTVALFLSLISATGFCLDLAGLTLSQLNYLIVFVILGGTTLLLYRRQKHISLDRRDFFIFLGIVVAAFLLAEYFAVPALLPVGPSDDAPRHFGLIKYILDSSSLPSTTTAVPLNHYSAGLHINVAFWAGVFHIQAIQAVHTYLSIIFGLLIGALYTFSIKHLGKRGALIFAILAASSPLLFSVPLAQGYWPQFLAIFLFVCFLSIESESEQSSFSPGFLSMIIASALVIIYPLYAILAILTLTIIRISNIKPLTSRANQRYFLIVSIWSLTMLAFAVHTRFFTTITSFNQFGRKALLLLSCLAVAILVVACTALILRKNLRRLFAKTKDARVVKQIMTLRIVDAVGLLLCLFGLLVTIGNFLVRYLWVGSIFDDKINPTITQTLMFYTVWSLVGLTAVGLVWYLIEKRRRFWYHLFLALSIIVLLTPLAEMFGFSNVSLLKYLVFKMVFILIVPILFFTSLAVEKSIKMVMSVRLRQDMEDYPMILTSAVLILAFLVILMQGAVTIDDAYHFQYSLKPGELRTSEWLAAKKISPEKVWFTGDLPKQLWHMHVEEVYEKADKKWWDKHPTVTLSDWPDRAKSGDVLLVNDAHNFGEVGSDYKETTTFSHQKDDTDIYQTLDVKGKLGNNSQQFEDAATVRVKGYSDGIQEFLYPKDITEPGMVTYLFRQQGSIQGFKADVEVRALTKEDSVTILYSINNGRTWVVLDRVTSTDWTIASVSIKPEVLETADGVKLRFDLRSKSGDVSTGIRRMNAYMTMDTTKISLETKPYMILKRGNTSIKYPILHKDGVSVLVRYVAPSQDR